MIIIIMSVAEPTSSAAETHAHAHVDFLNANTSAKAEQLNSEQLGITA